VGIQEDLDRQSRDGSRIVVELVVPVEADLAGVLQPVERRLAGELTARLVEHGGERRIPDQVRDGAACRGRSGPRSRARSRRCAGAADRPPCGDGVGDAKIAEARGQPLDEPDRPVGRPEQDRAAIRGDRAAVEGAHKFAPTRGSKSQLVLATLCRHRGASPCQSKSLRHNNFR